MINNIFFIVVNVTTVLVTTLFAFVIGYPNTVSLVTASSPSNSSNLLIEKVAATAEPSLISSNAGSNSEIGFDTQNITHRCAEAEWPPHQGQTTTSQEWWYVTALLNDTSGNRYLLFKIAFQI